MTPALTLSAVDIGFAALLLAVNVALSVIYGLGVHRSLVVAAMRMIAQLALVGLVLHYVFASKSMWMTLAAATVMVAAAALEVRQRQSPRIRGFGVAGLGLGALSLIGAALTFYVVSVVIGPVATNTPGLITSFSPRHVLPILGMILGNSLTALSLALSTFADLARREHASIEAQLALGHSAREAFQPISRRAMRTAMLPVINAMAVIGLVTLPGMMTGQILAGADPTDAAKLQIMIMFAISAASGLGAFAAVRGGLHLLTDDRQRLRIDRIAA
ncbi:MAG TPA: ABC transporter permease [Hyphomicrobiaceae bacterium]|nr:ABC transporter permease [Hyphomicrobiaceae bacterium]